MFEKNGIFTREELFELFKLYTEKQLEAKAANNHEMWVTCDKGRIACFEAIEELNRKARLDVTKRIGA